MSERKGSLVATFGAEPGVLSALAALREQGVGDEATEVLSSIPLDRVETPRSRVLWFALSGGVLGALAVFLLASLSAMSYPLATGGMAIVAGPPVGLVTYEGTALGAILATVLGVILEARLWRRSRPLAAATAALAAGRHVIVVDLGVADRSAEDLQAALAGAEAVTAVD